MREGETPSTPCSPPGVSALPLPTGRPGRLPEQKISTTMAKTSIHIEPANLGKGGSGSTNAEGHAYRETWYLAAVAQHPEAAGHFELIERDAEHRNEVAINAHYKGGAAALLERDKAEAAAHSKTGRAPSMKERTRTNPKNGRTYKVAGWSPIREAVIVCQENTTLNDFRPIVAWFEAHGIGVLGVAIHRDEGHTDARTGEIMFNNHAHMLLDYMDHKTGKTIKLPDEAMPEMQDVCAQALGMERGESKEKTSRRHLGANEYRAKAQAQELGRMEAEAAAAQLEAERARNEAANTRRQAAQGLAAKASALFGAGDLAKARKQAEEAEARAREAEARAARLDAAYQAAQREIRQRTEAATQMAKALQDEKANTAKAKKQGEFKGVRRMAEAVAKVAGEDGPILASLAIINAKQDGAEVSDKLWKDYQCEEVAAALRKKQSPKLR